jgi:hypothetical protein
MRGAICETVAFRTGQEYVLANSAIEGKIPSTRSLGALLQGVRALGNFPRPHQIEPQSETQKANMLMRKLLVLICVLGLPCASRAQSNSASWDNLKVVQLGEKIQVTETGSKKVSGAFVSVSEGSLSVEGEGGPQTIQRQDVRNVRLAKHGHRLRNTLIGAGVGAGVSAGIGAALAKPCQASQTYCIDPVTQREFAGACAVIGLAIGATIGALIPSHVTIYRVH